MWSLDRGALCVGLAERQVVFARTWPWGTVRATDGAVRACLSNEDQPPWRAAVDTLAAWLGQASARPRPVRVALSGRFVRWQLLPWNDALAGPAEWQAFARWRLRETYGPLADQWAIQYAVRRPGQTVCACAIDQGLIDAQQQTCNTAGVPLQSVTPYFASAFAYWRRKLDRRAAWFVVRESDCLSLGLLRSGDWLGITSSRVDGHWRAALDRMMLQAALPVGMEPTAAPMYLVAPAGTVDVDPRTGTGMGTGTQARGLQPPGDPAALAWRMAVGI